MKNSSLIISAYGHSDIGRKRNKNEDAYLITPELGLFVVADGMGGHAAGETASTLAVVTIEKIVRQFVDEIQIDDNEIPSPALHPAGKLLSDALRGACHAVHQLSTERISLHGMGTTTTAMLIQKRWAFVAHVGDSRAYLWREGQLLQLSEDHSLVNEQIKAGLMSPKEAAYSRLRNIITRSIGFDEDVDVDMIALPIQAHDVYLLCTDGLNSLVSDNEITQILEETHISEVPHSLIARANEKGGDDNITALVISVS